MKRAARYQEEKQLMAPPLVGWAALALFYRHRPVGVVLLLGVAVLGLFNSIPSIHYAIWLTRTSTTRNHLLLPQFVAAGVAFAFEAPAWPP